MKKRLAILLFAAVLLSLTGFSAYAARTIYVNDAASPLYGWLTGNYALGDSGLAPLQGYNFYALTSNGLTALSYYQGSGGSLTSTEGSVWLPSDKISVGLCYASLSRDNTPQEAQLSNVIGTGFSFGTLDARNQFVPAAGNPHTAEKQIIIRPLGDTGVGIYSARTKRLIYSVPSTGKSSYLAVQPISSIPNYLSQFSNGFRYYGDFAFADLGNGRLTVVNSVNIEKYTMGVCLGEIGTGFPMEAIKAQAVAARSYAIYNYYSNKYNDTYGFNLTADDYSQVYFGYTDSNAIISAVNDTANQYLTYQGAVICAMFFSSDGGETRDSEEVMPVVMPYLRGVIDIYEHAAYDGPSLGHRVGMSQMGALAMAGYYNKSYREILGFYYTGVGISYGYV